MAAINIVTQFLATAVQHTNSSYIHYINSVKGSAFSFSSQLEEI